MMPQAVSDARRNICQRGRCEHIALLDFPNPCAACPNGHWGVYSRKRCDKPQPSQEPARKFTAAKTPVARTWPIVLLPLKLLAKEGDRGAGDIIARTIGPIGGDAFKVWYQKLFRQGCG